jgi:hypothetical protein
MTRSCGGGEIRTHGTLAGRGLAIHCDGHYATPPATVTQPQRPLGTDQAIMPELSLFRQVKFASFLEDGKITQRKNAKQS